jgi:hypothetical protein
MNYFIIEDMDGVTAADLKTSLERESIRLISIHDTQYEAERGLAREIQLRGE